MNEQAPRVVLLARPGEACGRLEEALREAGAEIACVIDPTDGGPEQAIAAGPQAVLVALDPLVEGALERFDALLSDPTVTVIFDEAELAAQREGWDMARWVRHLAAKLYRHDDVLPPGRETETDWPLPGPLPARADLDELDITAFAGEAQERADAVPRDDDYLGPDRSGQEALTLATEKPGSVFGVLSLVDNDDQTKGVDDGAEPLGAILVEGGIGAPDAVRQLLAALPQAFPRAVLVRLELDGGLYDRLVKQMSRASTMPVVLAAAGSSADPGTVYFLEPTTTVAYEGGGLVFAVSAETMPALHAVLPSKDSAILLLSGSDVDMVDSAFDQAWSGALVAAQAVAECYEPAAATALSARGGETAEIAELAERLMRRWPSPAQHARTH
ncbi:chemotaxis protein CheB [soil metagenome]